MSAGLEVLEYHYADKVSYVQRVACGVDADISGGGAFEQFLLGAGHDVVDHSSPLEFFYKILHIVVCLKS